jgi:nitrite reductase/ring-hydroxylating ferredoxin subunit
VDALFDQCSHLSGPLSDGELTGDGDDLCVTCPWHGTVFRVADGLVRQGPGTHPQPVLQVRVQPDGEVQARLPEEVG